MSHNDYVIRCNKLNPIRSVKMKNRLIFLDGDPFQNYLLPLCNGFEIRDLALEIMRACAEYDRTVTWQAARYLAIQLLDDGVYKGDATIG